MCEFCERTGRLFCVQCERAKQAAAEPNDFWANVPVVSTYTRAQAIEDGVLVDLRQKPTAEMPDLDDFDELCRQAGIKYPLACTSRVFFDCIALTKAAEKACNDITGRLWDVLWMFSQAARKVAGNVLFFEVYVVVNRVRPSKVRLKAVIGPGDRGEPVITIMYHDED